MKIIEKAVTPDGMRIQIEDWRETYGFIKTLSIGTYPIMKRIPISRKLYWCTSGEVFRVAISRGFESDSEVIKAFEDLKNGAKQLTDFAEKFEDIWAVECI